MFEDKYDKLLNAAIVLLIASAAVLGYSVYNNNFSAAQNKTNAAVTNNLRDSLKNVYTNTVTSIDTNFVRNNVATNPELEEKYKEVEILRAEINSLLLKSTDASVLSAQQKIQELQSKIAILEIRYEDASIQNKKLQDILTQLKTDKNDQSGSVGVNDNSNAKTDADLQKQAKAILDKQKASNATKVNDKQQINQATEMSFYASTNGSVNQTTKILNADKLQGTFLFKYKTSNNSNEAIYIVIIQPDGKTIKGPSWDIGVFDSDEGKKVFTKKLMVDFNGEPQKLNFSVMPDDFIAGPYTMEIWYKKNLIGTKVRTLL